MITTHAGLQSSLLGSTYVAPFKTQLLKWVGNKQRFAHKIIASFPREFGTYYEPFLGSGAILATLSHNKAVASDISKPLMEIWQALSLQPDTLKKWYSERRDLLKIKNKADVYLQIRNSYNLHPNGADLLFLCRACYGGVVRFRQSDGHMSTPCGVHTPISSLSFAERVDIWRSRTKNTDFINDDYRIILSRAIKGDLVYCDPPYSDSQTILYGAQSFRLKDLYEEIAVLKQRGVYVVLSIDGTKKSGKHLSTINMPKGLFNRELFINGGRSMLRRFQMNGKSLENEVVADRLLLTY